MSGRQNSDNLETLFSFEFLVEYIRVEKESKVSDELAVGVRLLDFPTLLIYQPQQSSGGVDQQEQHGEDQQGEHAFKRGKSCFFKMNLNLLHSSLTNTPLYAMVLEVKEEIPKLIGESLISLTKAMDSIRQDVTKHGVSTPSSHGERRAVGICNLMGEKIGTISLSYKLLSLGASLLPHITERRGVHRGQHVHQSVKYITESTPLSSVKPSDENTLINEDRQDKSVYVDMQTEDKPRRQKTLNESDFEEDLAVFCPPPLFYYNSAEEKSTNTGWDCKLLNLDSQVFTFEDTEEEMSENKTEHKSSPMKDETASRNQETSAPHALGEALRQLPLLNALLVELSQLNGQNQHQPLSIHPNLSWIYNPASTEPSAGNTSRKAQTRPGTSPDRQLHSTRYCSTPVVRPASVKGKDEQEEAVIESKSSSKSPKKELVYGTTKTFNLRLKQISPLKVKRRECMDLLQKETQSSMAKQKTKSSNKIVKSCKRKSALNQSSSINENVETMIQSMTAESALQGTVTLKQKTLHGEQDRDLPRISKSLLSEREFIYIPSVDGDNVSPNKDKKEHHSESTQVKSQCESDRHRKKTECSVSSRHSSPKSSFSDSSGEGNEEADYADDFNSLEPSDACSPDPASSPEPFRAKTPKSPIHPDLCNSDSEGFQKRAALPMPIKAPSSPQRTVRGAYIIRPRTHTSALSFSSDDGDRDGSASLRTVCSRKQMTESSRAGRSSGTDSVMSSRGQRSEPTKNTGLVRGLSAESVSSYEPLEVEELEDELGSLDFKNEYRHISELVVDKLPGYTI